jgi:hypothetical protein
MELLFIVFATIAIVAFVVFAGAYALVFGPQVHFAWSRDPEDWERFGAYLGGVLGPIYGLLAFIGVLITLVFQRRQIDDLQAQSTQQPLQQLLATVSDKIDGILRAPPVVKPPDDMRFFGMDTVTVGQLLRAGAYIKSIAEKGALEVRPLHKEALPKVLLSLSIDAGELASEFKQLITCLDAYRAADGTPALEIFYKDRYAEVVGYLSELDFLRSTRVAERFLPLVASSPVPTAQR